MGKKHIKAEHRLGQLFCIHENSLLRPFSPHFQIIIIIIGPGNRVRFKLIELIYYTSAGKREDNVRWT